jgi:hypothetical protein
MAATAFAPQLSRRLFESRTARLLFVAIIALHPAAIDFSKEFKPYSVAIFFHLVLVLACLRYLDHPAPRSLAWALGTAVVGLLFTQDLVFAFPGVFLLLGSCALRRARSEIVAVGLTAIGLVSLLVILYVFIWSQLPSDESEYWGNKYNVFFTAQQGESRIVWWLRRQADLMAFPGYRRKDWVADWPGADVRVAARAIDFGVWFVVQAAGLISLAVRRRARDGLLLVMPIVTMWVFNAAGFWPGGVFRTNLFLLVYTSAIAAAAFDGFSKVRSTLATIGPTALLVLVPLALFDGNYHHHKSSLTHDSSMRELMKQMLRVERRLGKQTPPTPLVVDRRSCPPFTYYTGVHPRGQRLASAFETVFSVRCARSEAKLAQSMLRAAEDSSGRIWVVVHDTRAIQRLLRSARFARFSVARRDYRRPHTAFVIEVSPSLRRPAKRETRQGD